MLESDRVNNSTISKARSFAEKLSSENLFIRLLFTFNKNSSSSYSEPIHELRPYMLRNSLH